MRVTKAKSCDLKFLLKTYNFYVKKKLFSSNKIVKYPDHKEWFEQLYLKQKKIHIFVSKIKKVKIGYIRFDKVKKNIFEISLALKRDYIGLGLGTKMLKITLKKFLFKKNFIIVSKVKKNNKNSISCFKQNNFAEISFKKKFFYKLNNTSNYYYFKHVDKFK